jgi:hypothetical protein
VISDSLFLVVWAFTVAAFRADAVSLNLAHFYGTLNIVSTVIVLTPFGILSCRGFSNYIVFIIYLIYAMSRYISFTTIGILTEAEKID